MLVAVDRILISGLFLVNVPELDDEKRGVAVLREPGDGLLVGADRGSRLMCGLLIGKIEQGVERVE